MGLMDKQPKVTVIGGGTGAYVTLSGLKHYPLDLSAIITVADSGGSTGRLRDEFGFLPVGDLRQALAALSADEPDPMVRKLLLYRFAKGSGIEGHNLGNLILTALQDMTGSTARAIEAASKIFRLKGHIYPITTTPVQLVIEYEDGTVEIGEHVLDEKHGGKKIVGIKTSPRAKIYSQAKKAIAESKVLVIGPGDLYGSIMPNLVVEGAREAFKKTPGKIIYIANLMTRYTQTHNMSVKDHIEVIAQAIDRQPDYVLMNSRPVPKAILKAYRLEHEYPVEDDLTGGEPYQVIRAPLNLTRVVKNTAGDTIRRSFLRHDPKKLAIEIMKIIEA